MSQTIAALLVFLFPLAYSPGPGNLFFAANGARFGVRATLPANFGYHGATWIVTAGLGYGFIAALDRFPAAFWGLKITGSFYVLFLAWRIFRANGGSKLQTAQTAGVFDGVVLLLLNPKALIIIGLMFTQFLRKTSFGNTAEILIITTVFTLNNFVAFLVWTVAGDRIAYSLRKPNSAIWTNRIFGLILAAVALWMLLA